MARVAALVALALCLFGLSGFAQAHKIFDVEGNIYCDPCRLQFVSNLTRLMPDVEVSLVCRSLWDGTETYKVNGITGKDGIYRLKAEERRNEICHVEAMRSPIPDICGVPWGEVAMVSLADDNSGSLRKASCIGFMPEVAAPECKCLFEEIGIDDENEDNLLLDPDQIVNN